MGKLLLRSVRVAPEGGNTYELRYHLMSNPLFDAFGEPRLSSYGIEIAARRGSCDWSNGVPDVDVDEGRVRRLVDTLADYAVMPEHLRDVLMDLLAGG